MQPLHIAKGNARKCLVELSSPGQARQRIVVIGESETEALSCGRIVAFGKVLASAGQAWIAFLYRAYSPAAENLISLFIEREKSEGIWSINVRLGQRIGERGELDTIPKIRAALKRSVR